jgi:hypothetical protein
LRRFAKRFGLRYGDLLAYAASNHWVRGPVKRHAEDLGDLASALALQMFGSSPLRDRSKRFVAAMVALGAQLSDIADPLQVSEDDLKREFARELAGTRA